MKSTKFIAVFCVLTFWMGTGLFAEDVEAGSVKIPKRNEVVLVGRISFKNPIDLALYRDALDPSEEKNKKTGSYGLVNKSEDEWAGLWDFEEPFYCTVKLDSDRICTIESFDCYLFGMIENIFYLPGGVKIHIPDGAQFVYIGNFEYDLDYALRPVGFNHYDEFDRTQEQVNRATGKNVELYRGEIEFLSE